MYKRQVLEYNAKQVNIVATGNAELEILIDDAKITKQISGVDVVNGKIMISEPRLYNIIESFYGESHTITINVTEPNFEIFTFTFG